MNIYGKIARYFIENKKLSFLIMLGIILWGTISFIIMPKQYNPDIVAPAFSIKVSFPGASVDEVYQVVAKPLEDILNEIPGVENIYSKSLPGGRAQVIVEFFVGEDMEESMIKLRQKIASRLNLKPLGVNDPSITTIDPDDLPIKTFALYSDNINPIMLRKYAYYLRDELKTITGTSIIDVIGGRIREFQIILDPEKMKETKTSFDEIKYALNNTSVLKDIGLIKSDRYYYTIETREQVVTTTDIENLIIVSNVEEILQVKDVARVIEGEKEYNNFIGFYRRDLEIENAVFITIAKKEGTNIITVSNNIDKKMKELRDRLPYLHDITIETVKDDGRIATEEINGLIINLIQAIGIVFVVLLAFLNYRAAFIVAFSIPMTLLVVFILGYLFGYTINRITLFALILSLGLLVDSATVVIENIVKNKNKQPDLSKDILIPQSISQVGNGLFLSTVTTVLAFIPMLFVTGMMGPYMGPLPFFVSSAIVVSLVFAYSLNPWLASVVCKDGATTYKEKTHCGFICTVIDSVFTTYRRILDSLLRNPRTRRRFLFIMFVVFIGIVLFPVLRLARFRMLPKADREQMYVYINLDRGTSLERSQTVARTCIDALKNEEYIKSIQSFVAAPPVRDFNGLFKGVSERRETHHITLKVNLIHPDKRDVQSEDLALRYRTVVQNACTPFADARIKIIEDPPGPPVRSTFYVKVKSRNPDLLHTVAQDIEARVGDIHGVTDIDTSRQEENEKYVLSINKRAAADALVSVEKISNELETIFSGNVIGVYHSDYNYEQEYIILKFSRELRDSIDDLEHIYIINRRGIHIPVAKFVTIKKAAQEDIIRNDNRERVIYISGEMEHRSVTYAAIDLLKMLFIYTVSGHTLERTYGSLLTVEYLVDGSDMLKIQIGGEWELTVKVFRDLGLAMFVAIIMIYLILVARFNSFRIPLLIMITIPLALIGVFPGFTLLFMLKRVYFSATSMIGIIALAGIVVNNAIIFIEYTMQAAHTNTSLRDTLLDAGTTRMRPILLTSITTILGSIVIATDPVWSGLAWSIVFGLSLSSLLTLIVFPSLICQFLGDPWFHMIKSEKRY